MTRYVAALVAVLALVLSYFVKSTGLVALLLLVAMLATLTSLLGFVSSRISASSRSEIYVPTADERALLAKRNERLRQEHEQRRAEGHRLETGPPAPKPKPPPP